MGLALGKEIRTDCSINATVQGKMYCFGNEDAKTIATAGNGVDRDPVDTDAETSSSDAIPERGRRGWIDEIASSGAAARCWWPTPSVNINNGALEALA